MIHLWVHVGVVLALLTAHGLTVRWAVRRIRELQNVIQAKRALLGAPQALLDRTYSVVAGDTLTLRDANGDYMEIRSSSTTTIQIRVFDR